MHDISTCLEVSLTRTYAGFTINIRNIQWEFIKFDVIVIEPRWSIGMYVRTYIRNLSVMALHDVILTWVMHKNTKKPCSIDHNYPHPNETSPPSKCTRHELRVINEFHCSFTRGWRTGHAPYQDHPIQISGQRQTLHHSPTLARPARHAARHTRQRQTVRIVHHRCPRGRGERPLSSPNRQKGELTPLRQNTWSKRECRTPENWQIVCHRIST